MTDWINKLEQAKRLLDAGALTPEEFEAEKLKILPRTAPIQVDPEMSPWKRAAEHRNPLSPMIIALGVVPLILAGGAVIFRHSENRKVIVRPAVLSAPTVPPEPAILAPVETANVAVEPAQCGSRDLKINLPGVESSGFVVINYPLDDTDAMGSLEFSAHPFVCVTPAQLSKFASPSSNSAMANDVLVSFSRRRKYESALNYSVLMCSELAETPRPPASLKIGAFKWLRTSAPEVSVKWYSDFREHIESTCFCDDGEVAPCKVDDGVP